MALVRYVCSLPNPGTKGTVRELFYPDSPEGRARAEKFARHENKPGRGVYDCIGRLQDGARSRRKDTVADLDQVVADLDLKNITQRRDAVLQCVKGLVLPPSEIRDSGFGLHLIWHLKEPVEDDDGLAQAETTMKRLAELLAGDLKPTHRAALLRHPGSDNTKGREPRPCRTIEAGGAAYDISEFDDMFDLYADRPLLTRKAEAAKGNGHDRNSEQELRTSEGRLDVEAALAAMQPTGASINDIQPRVILSLLQRAEHPSNVIEQVVNATMAVADAAGLGWTREEEIKAVVARVKSSLALLHREYDPTTGSIPNWLAADFHNDWITMLERGACPVLRRTGFGSGWCVKAASGSPRPEDEPSRHRRKPQNDDEPSAGEGAGVKKAAAPFVLRPFVPFDPATLPPREWLYGRHYQRRTVGGTVAPGGVGKTTLCMVEGVAMATCRNLLGEQPTERLRVWFHNGEDNIDELNRRLAAICQHFDIPMEELRGWWFMTSGNEVPLRVAKGYSNLTIDTRLIKCITEAIGDNQIDATILDPLVTLHGVPENDTGKMDTVVRIFAGIADAQDCAVELSHHTRKLLAGSTADYALDDMRGASALKDAMRAVRMLNLMTKADAEGVGIPEFERTSYFRVDRVKGNNAAPPSAAIWRKFVNVDLPNSDEVGVVVPWEFPGQGAAPSPQKAEAERRGEAVFLALLDRFATDGRNVSDRGPTSAPALFAKEPEARAAKLGKAPLAEAMRRLFASAKIRMEPYGRTDHGKQRIART